MGISGKHGLTGLLALSVLTACSSPAAPEWKHGDALPQRIVSMNPCVDAVLKEVADPSTIASVSIYSHDPDATSVPVEWARRYPANSGSAEDIIAAKPDLVISGPHVSAPTVAALKRLGVPMLQLPVSNSLADDETQITMIADRIGRPQQGRALIERIGRVVDATKWQGKPITGLIWQSGSLVPGKGTLADALMTHTGFHNLSVDQGLAPWDVYPAEELLTNPPAVLLAGGADLGEGPFGAGGRPDSKHPILRHLQGRMQVVDYPSSLLRCGGPVMIPALQRLAEARRAAETAPLPATGRNEL